MTKNKRFSFDVVLYSARIHVTAGGDPRTANQWLEKKLGIKIEVDDVDNFAAWVVNKNQDCGVWFRALKPHAHVVAHESVHITSRICHAVGVKGDFNNDEPLAYLVSYLTREIGRRLWA